MNESEMMEPSCIRPRYIAIEGPIGVGKTTLARRLADSLQLPLLRERAEENPFLERFYRHKPLFGLQTQLFFLLQRARQLKALAESASGPGLVSDFLLEKDRLFAQVLLPSDELALYEEIYAKIAPEAARPDLVVYLQAPVDVLFERIRERGSEAERSIERAYLEQLNDAYARLFHYYEGAPLLIVNAERIDFAHCDDDYRQLLDYLLTIEHGRHYFNPGQSPR